MTFLGRFEDNGYDFSLLMSNDWFGPPPFPDTLAKGASLRKIKLVSNALLAKCRI